MRESISTLFDLLTRSEFHTGLGMGAFGLVVLAVGPRQPSWGRPWAMITTLAVLVGVHVVDDRRFGLAVGVALMALGGGIVGRAPSGRPTRCSALGWPVIAIGAVLIPWRGQIDTDDWVFTATPLVAIGVGAALATWSKHPHRPWIGLLFAITAFAVWTTVPDTELARLLLGVTLPLALGTLPPVSARSTAAGTFALGGVYAWLPTLGGESRPASIIGAWACIGMLAVVPMAIRLWHGQTRLGVLPLLMLHVGLVVVAARVIGLWSWAVPAAIAALALYAATLTLVHHMDKRSLPSEPGTS